MFGSPRTSVRSSREQKGAGVSTPGSDPVLERIAWLLDNSLRVPGTRYRIGVDPLLGLFPGVGDFLSAVIQSSLVMLALKRYNVPKAVATRMATNVLLDMGLGSIPILGDLFDATFKASSRNIHLLREVQSKRHQGLLEGEIAGSSRRHLMILGGLLGVGLTLTLIGAIFMIVWLFKVIANASGGG